MLDTPMSDEKNYNVLTTESGLPIKAWTKGVQLEDQARKQLLNVAQLPFIFKWVAAMPDVHLGMGATVGSVIPTRGAIIPAAVGVDIGCGMMAVQTSLHATICPTICTAFARRLKRRCRTDVPTMAARTTVALGRTLRHVTWKCGEKWSRRTRRSSRSIPS